MSEPVKFCINDPVNNMFLIREAEESEFIPVFKRRSFVDDICFGGRLFDDCLATLSIVRAVLLNAR